MLNLRYCGCGQCWSAQVIIYKLSLITPYLWFLCCINNPYKSLLPAVLSLSLFHVLTVLFYCFWLQVHSTYLSHQNKYALYMRIYPNWLNSWWGAQRGPKSLGCHSYYITLDTILMYPWQFYTLSGFILYYIYPRGVNFPGS